MPAVNVLDMSSGDARPKIVDFGALAAKGIAGVIHRASEGVNFTDPFYTDRMHAALDAGLLWGALHTIDASDAWEQAARFLSASGMNSDISAANGLMLAVDYSKLDSPAALHQLYDFCGEVDRGSRVGVQIVIRGGSYLRETLRQRADDTIAPGLIGAVSFFRQHRLWCDEITFINSVPAPAPWPWTGYFLRAVRPGIADPVIGKIGCNTFDGSAQALVNSWAA